jgi:hypothetical protein
MAVKKTALTSDFDYVIIVHDLSEAGKWRLTVVVDIVLTTPNAIRIGSTSCPARARYPEYLASDGRWLRDALVSV